ncbi:transcription termination factor Rho [Mycobacterium sp. Soil538]|nr:transcription termination factor Rho [Mycobacterium sp. Soil538]
MTDTDLITAGGGSDSDALPTAVATDTPAAPAAAPARRGALTSLVLPELRAMAKEIGIEGASGMRKSELIAAIRERRGEKNSGAPAAEAAPSQPAPAADGAVEQAPAAAPQRRERRSASREQGGPASPDQPKGRDDARPETAEPAADAAERKTDQGRGQGRQDNQGRQDQSEKTDRPARSQNDGGGRGQNDNPRAQNDNQRSGGQNDNQRAQNDNQRGGGQNDNQRGGGQNDNDDDGGDRQGRRGRRFRDRRRRERGGEGGGGNDRDTELREDDVVQPVAGILDVLDNYAFVRTSGYLAGPNDVYVSMNMVRKNGLRRGDAVTGAVRVPKDGDGGGQNARQKFNPLVRLDSVNGKPVDEARKRPEFQKLTPLYPNTRLRLETTPDKLTTRVIDLIMPIGKGQRALIVSPPKAGKTTIMQDIANAITRNNPECHLMVVLVDERPEEVTDMQRSVKGEVIASTFDRPPSDHTQAAELAIERAKRLVEDGKDVVVLLDSITRLGRAYNNASPASGRILSGGVDSTALYPPKRFLGAARNIEEGGSLTIIATAMVETGSTGDTVIFEEFKGTGNAELKLDRKISERRVFPAVDVNPSGTRKDELLLSSDEFAVVHKLRRVLSGLDPHQAIDLLMSQLRKTKNNYEFLVQVSKNTPGGNDHD